MDCNGTFHVSTPTPSTEHSIHPSIHPLIIVFNKICIIYYVLDTMDAAVNKIDSPCCQVHNLVAYMGN